MVDFGLKSIMEKIGFGYVQNTEGRKMNHFTLDLETKAKNERDSEYAALEPWRVRQGKATIRSCDIRRPDGSYIQFINDTSDNFNRKLLHALDEMKGAVCWGHNTMFDIAWMIATLQPNKMGAIPQAIRDVKWRDTMLLAKWLINGQRAEEQHISLSLANCVKMWLKSHPKYDEFLSLKSVIDDSEEYWLSRGTIDVEMTFALAEFLVGKLPDSMKPGLTIEFDCLVPIANSWLMGIKIDQDLLEKNEKHYKSLKSVIAKELSVPETLFSSPKQLSDLLFNQLSIKPVGKTPTGNPSTSKGDLMWMSFYAKQDGNTEIASVVDKILAAKQSSTVVSKYIKTTYEALSHTGDGFIYCAPRIFGTYTGRMTYSNSTKKKYKTGIAFHQMPRKEKRIREMLIPPEGYFVGEVDAAAQESRLMAIRSKDPVMLDIFKNNLNFHSMTGSSILGLDYDEFEQGRLLEKDGGYYTEARQRGKLTNLACNFRISGRALAKQAFEKYEVMIDVATGNFLVKTFIKSYKGVPQYWDDVIYDSKQLGYTESFGGRRFKLYNWKTNSWETESSALMVPIQGSGASMKEIAIHTLFRKIPNANFSLDLHDASFFYAEIDKMKETFDNVMETLNDINYKRFWGFEPEIALPYEGGFGKNFSEIK